MKRKVTQFERKEVEEIITICDHCGREANDPTLLIANPKVFRTHPRSGRHSTILGKGDFANEADTHDFTYARARSVESPGAILPWCDDVYHLCQECMKQHLTIQDTK